MINNDIHNAITLSPRRPGGQAARRPGSRSAMQKLKAKLNKAPHLNFMIRHEAGRAAGRPGGRGAIQ